MTMETIPAASRGRDYEDDLTGQPLDEDTQPGNTPQRRDAVVIVGAGLNTLHMGDSIARLGEQHPVHVFEVREPLIPVAPDRLHLVNTAEGQESARRLIGSGAVHAVYGSIPPGWHKPFLLEHLANVGRGLIDIVVVTKPIVENLDELREVRAAERAAQDLRGSTDPILYVHEHYKEKGAWHTLREQLGEVTNRLGRLRNVIVDIEEARTVEQEDRVVAFGDGALKDLGPHAISLGLDVLSSINAAGRYTITDPSQTSVDRVRYEDSDLPEGVETGFIIRGNTQITDNKEGLAHNLQFALRGGKGLIDNKRAVLEFVHPETGDHAMITVDLRNNTLDVPLSVADLFPETKFNDNGYGYVVEVGLNGGDPRKSFQSSDEAKLVTVAGRLLARQGQSNLHTHPQGMSLQELDEHSFQ